MIVLLLMVLLAWVSPAAADEVINVHLNDKVAAGEEPSLVVSIYRDIAALALDLRRDDGKLVQVRITNVPRDAIRTFRLPQKTGRHRYRGSLTVTFTGTEQGVMDLDFIAEVVSGLGLKVKRKDLDLERHTLTLRSRRPLIRLEYEITGDDGSRLGHGSLVSEPSSVVQLAWKQKPGKVLKIRLVGHDPDGIHEDLELIPWTYFIPHEEVEFETGKWDIRPPEAPKLDRSFGFLLKGVAKYGQLLDAKLYIAGYTDTVAAADYNQGLSEKRALAIARYFRSKGFTLPIFYQGFGETGLKVATKDETDEPRNRRAEYVLAAEPPHMDTHGATSQWKRLP